ncbi:MAG TPA: FAD-dependent monooxygenase, partial [Thermomicrobiales bacterium]|nr:FAD-dependent monooxygenase [Thermomicrobiales bacterium]
GKAIGVLDRTAEERRFGAAPIVLKRGLLHQALRDAAIRRGIPVAFGKRLTDIEARTEGGVAVRFAGGASDAGDLLIGCDGIHSPTRRFVVPDGPKSIYTGIVGFSGFSRPSPPIPADGAMGMTFGKRAFFGSFAAPNGEVYWYDNVPWPREPAANEFAAAGDAELRQRLLSLHADDPAPIPAIVRATTSEIGTWAIYDIPSLAAWSRGPVCLVGDAAHATSPHGAQGASLALEDAVVVAKCLRDLPTIETAFAACEGLRKARVERQVRQARRTGAQNVAANPVGLWLRDRLLPLLLTRGERANDWLHAYRVDWQTPIAA